MIEIVDVRSMKSTRSEGAMNNQSDYGYSIGGIENRTPELCLQRAASCERLATVDLDRADEYRQWAHAWRVEADEARIRRQPRSY